MYEDGIFIKQPTDSNVFVVRIEFNPTVPHCSLATLIGLCIRIKIMRSFAHNLKLDIFIKKGSHNTEEESEYMLLENSFLLTLKTFTNIFCLLLYNHAIFINFFSLTYFFH